MTENQRLKILQAALKFPSQEKFASALGIKQGSLSDIYREKGGIGVSDSIKRKLEKEYSINIDWLETGEGQMLKPSAPVIAETPQRNWEPPVYYAAEADAKDVVGDLRAKVRELEEKLRIKDLIIQEKDQQIKDKDRVLGNMVEIVKKFTEK